MTVPDVVQRTLDYIDSNWNTNNYSPQPTLIDGDDMHLDASGDRARSTDLVNTNVVTVDASPAGTNEPIGTEYDHRIRYGANVTIEAYHTDGGGQVADKDEFNTLVTEVRRTILAERTWPSNTTGITHLAIEEENDLSADGPVDDANYFRYEFDVWFEGFESL